MRLSREVRRPLRTALSAVGTSALVALAMVSFLAHPLAAEPSFPEIGWTLSASATDPLANAGPATADTLTLYLWLYCSDPAQSGLGGIESTRSVVREAGGLEVHAFEPSGGVVNHGVVPPDLDLTLPGCPEGSFLVGTLVVQNLVGSFQVCLDPPSDESTSFSYACASPGVPRENAFRGYSASFGPVCTSDVTFFDLCDPVVSIDSETWGRIKAGYRRDRP